VISWKAVCSHLDTYRTGNQNSALNSCLRHDSFTVTQPPRLPRPPRSIPPPSGVAYLGLCTELLGHHSVLCLLGLFLPALLRESRLRNDSPVQECQSLDTLGNPATRQRGIPPPEEGASEHFSQMEVEVSWSMHQIVRNESSN
jgi:hypothetical protein